jgi:glyoxylase-like metal-dependent hydrolase (beta-lactamase superfamily II)
MLIETVVVGDLRTNCYIAYDPGTKEAVIIDPGSAHAAILKVVGEKNLKPLYILHTHGHPDHFEATEEIRKATNAEVVIHKSDAAILEASILSLRSIFIKSTRVDKRVKGGDVIKFGSRALEVIHTPGHSKGGACFYSKADSILFSGDTLFNDAVGRTDLPGGSSDELMQSLKKLLSLPENTKVLPGHGSATTIRRERINLGELNG